MLPSWIGETSYFDVNKKIGLRGDDGLPCRSQEAQKEKQNRKAEKKCDCLKNLFWSLGAPPEKLPTRPLHCPLIDEGRFEKNPDS